MVISDWSSDVCSSDLRACSSLLCPCGSSPQPRLVGGTILRIHLRKRGPTGPAFGDDDAIRSARSFGFGGASRPPGPTYGHGGIVGLHLAPGPRPAERRVGQEWVRTVRPSATTVP